MTYLLLGLLAAGLLGFIAIVLYRVSPAMLARWLRGLATIALIAGGIYLFLRGQAVFDAFLAIPLLALWRSYIAGKFSKPASKSGANRSSVDTEWLSMSLDHVTGASDGMVKKGAFSGRTLSSLSRRDLISLLTECGMEDTQSATLVEAFLDRQHPDWRVNGDNTSTSQMSREEALSILGLQPSATEAEIKEAHRRLMKKLHPDHGGSNYLAGQINRAKDVLLN